MLNSFLKKIKFKKTTRGFTLIEVMVASSVFIVVTLIVSGSIVSVFAANQKSNTLRSVMDNLNLALESMTRTIRFADTYHCGTSGSVSLPQDCASASVLTVKTSTNYMTYSLVGSRIQRQTTNIVSGVSASSYVTSPDVNITNLTFKVTGSEPFISGPLVTCASTNCQQPKVVIIIKGTVGAGNYVSTLNLETLVSQRLFDYQ